jgi:isoleucyl-tRNA synthetase
MYREHKQLHLPSIDAEIRQFWEDERIFEQSVEQRDPKNSFVFYEGPPSANGKPGIHHVMARTVKDLFCRYNTLRGYRVERKGGWDTHGLPIELQVEKELGITKEDIGKKVTVEEYNAACRSTVMRYKDLWDDITRRMGYWVDLDAPYITFENEYIETVWYILQRLYRKQTPDGQSFLYKGFTIQPYSPAAGTGLSTHELNMPGTYKEVTDISAVAMFQVLRNSSSAHLFDSENEDLRILAWTTTPWTLPSNVALTVGPNIEYVKVKTLSPYTGTPLSVVLAKSRLSAYFSAEGENQPLDGYKIGDKKLPYSVTKQGIKGADLVGIRYEQLLPMPDLMTPELEEKAFRVIPGDWVTTEDGTGVVHTAPYFGADDFRACRAAGIPFIGVFNEKAPDLPFPLVDKQGKFVDEVPEFGGRYVKAEYYPAEVTADKDFKSTDLLISLRLKEDNKAFRVEKYKHTYPHCWRTEKPVLYYPLDSWFVRASAAKERLAELNRTINWQPESTGTGRFGAWLDNLQDWNLSRSRYWGVPLPIWRTEDGEEEICVGSVMELREEIEKANAVLGLSQKLADDLHRPYIDEVVLVSPSGKPMRRELDLIDVWFDSGSMPYAQWGLDYEKLKNGDDKPFKTPFQVSYPATFIAEGVDQTRGWFYTLHAIAGMVYDSVAFQNVVSNGLVLDKNGKKMSKSLGNATDPFETLDEYGADATRWYMMASANPWDNLKFDTDGILETRNKLFGTLFNTYNFFALYANLDGFKMDEQNVLPYDQRTELDRWVISKLYSLVADYRAAMDAYDVTRACRAIETFVDEHLSNWYVRLNRRRFWKGELNDDKVAAYQTLFECLMVTGQLMSPVAPFFSDWLYRNLTAPVKTAAKANGTPLRHDSVHLSDLTQPEPDKVDKALEKRMDYAQRICSLAFSIRQKEKLRVRLPLQKILLPVLDEQFIAEVDDFKSLILSEINVKQLEYVTDASGLLKKGAKANFKTLGAKLGKDMKAAAELIAAFTNDDINALEKSGSRDVTLNGNAYTLTPDDLIVSTEDLPGWKVATDAGLTVALDVTLTDDLLAEGTARDLVNRIQNIRKDKDFQVTDRVVVSIQRHEAVLAAVERFRDYIKAEVLATDLVLVDAVDAEKVEMEDGAMVGIEVVVAGAITPPIPPEPELPEKNPGIMVEKVRVRNFRSLKDVEVELSPLTLLVGANNAGKTSFLRAINLALGVEKRGVTPDDLFIDKDGQGLADADGNIQQTITIDLKIIPVDKDFKRVEVFDKDWTPEFLGDVDLDGEQRFFAFRTQYRFSGKRAEPEVKRFALKGNWADPVFDENSPLVASLEKLPLYFMDAQRDILDDLRNRTSFFGRLAAQIDYDPKVLKRLETELAALNNDAVENSAVMSHLKSKLKELNAAIQNKGEGVEITPLPKKIRDLHKTMKVHFQDGDSEVFELDYHGMGTRSWASLLAFKAFVSWEDDPKNPKPKRPFFPLLALEEPEAHLHPNAQRHIYGQLSGINGQKVISTHSPQIVGQAEINEIRFFLKNSDETTIRQVDIAALTVEQKRQIKRRVLHSKGELLFSKIVVLAEGETEEQALPVLAAKYFGKDPLELGINFVGCGGSGYGAFLRVFEKIGLPWFVFSDYDTAETKSHVEEALKSNNLAASDSRLFLLNVDIEKYLVEQGYQNELRAACEEFSNHYFSIEKKRIEFIEKFNQDDTALLEFAGGKKFKVKIAPLWAEKISEINDKNRRFPPQIKALFDAISHKLNIPVSNVH